MPVFDFHVHPALKAQMSAPASRPSPWDTITIKFKNPTLLTRMLSCQGINEVIDSQASLTQLVKGKVNLIGLALHPPETAMMRDALINTLAKQEQTQYIDLNRIRDIASGDIYFQMLNEELDNLKTHTTQAGKKLKIISKFSEYNASDLNTIHAVLILEGPHAFWGLQQGHEEEARWRGFWENFEIFTTDNRILSINIAHLQQNDFCNHAFGIQIFKQEPFYPTGNGISQHGFRLLQRMEQKGILLDIKHMSLYARRQLRDYRPGTMNKPMICTHAGLTGIDYEKRGKFHYDHDNLSGGFVRVKHYKPAGYLAGTAFNASSINLYDEDVRDIVFSGGIIGLSMDQRILGLPDDLMLGDDYTDDFFDTEVISPQEKDFFMQAPRSQPVDSDYLDVYDILLEDRQNYPRYHARHFLNQVFHFFIIADKYRINAAMMAERICIGSDFDGVINPLDGCRNVTQLEAFKKYLLKNFEAWELEAMYALPVRISSFIKPADLMENIFYRNAVNFLKENFK